MQGVPFMGYTATFPHYFFLHQLYSLCNKGFECPCIISDILNRTLLLV